jgi:ABC-type antimicrobial peptide transport system permease subunit
LAVDKDPPPLSLYNYVLANIQRHKLRYGLTIFGLIICIVFFIIVASLSIGLYEPTEPEITPDENTSDPKYLPPEVVELDENVKKTIVNWLYLTAVMIFATAVAGVSNTMLMSMSERKREIGILKSVGLKRNEILQIFFMESFTICLIAFAIGVIAGLHFANNIFNYVGPETGRTLFFATMRTPPVVLLAAFIIVFVVGLLSGIAPAYRAVKLTPVEALKK